MLVNWWPLFLHSEAILKAVRKSILFTFFFAVFLTLPLVASEKPYIISGFDDVLRRAENTGLIKASLKIFEKDKTFSGMCELYSVISANETVPAFTLVSAISNWFDGRIENLLTRYNCPSHQSYLRNWLTQWSIQSFKIASLK
jgi:hypothetical protein